jgi:hypothetical protein
MLELSYKSHKKISFLKLGVDLRNRLSDDRFVEKRKASKYATRSLTTQ